MKFGKINKKTSFRVALLLLMIEYNDRYRKSRIEKECGTVKVCITKTEFYRILLYYPREERKMPNERLQKRQDLMSKIMQGNLAVPEKEAVQGLYNQIQEFRNSKKKLDKDDVEKLIQNYEKCGVAYFNGLEEAKKKNDTAKTEMYHKLIKKYSKDYSALYKYMRRLEAGLADEKKMDIEEFFDNSRTRTVSIGGKSMDELDKAGAGMSVRHKVPFNVVDEPIDGLKEGDQVSGFFTENGTYYSVMTEDNVSKMDEYKIAEMIHAKYPNLRNSGLGLNADPDTHSDWFDFITELNEAEEREKDEEKKGKIKEWNQNLRLHPERFLTKYTCKQFLQNVREMTSDKSDKDFKDSFLIETIDKFNRLNEADRDVAYHALIEYISNVSKAEFGRGALNTIGVDFRAPVAERNALMSAMADIFGCGDVIAFSEKMKVKAVEGDKIVTKKGTVMMPAKGIDPSGTDMNDALANMCGVKTENSKGIILSIAKLQFVDILCGNTDRHGNNLFYQFDENGNLIGVQGIDNDNSFGSVKDSGHLGNGIPFENLGVIPKSMADVVKAMKPETYAMMLQGYGVDEGAIKARTESFKEIQAALKKCEAHYKDAVPGYLDLKVPRIVPDNEMDKYSFNEQLAKIGAADPNVKDPKVKPRQNLFGRIGSWTQKTNQYSKIINMNDKIMKTAAELEEALLVKNEGSLHGSVDKLKGLMKDMSTDPKKNKSKKLTKDEKAKYDQLDAIAKKTESLFTNENFKRKYIVNSNIRLGNIVTGEAIYTFNGEAYKSNGIEEIAFHDATIKEDEKYQAFEAAFEEAQNYLVENSKIGMKYQELQEDVALAKTADEKKDAVKALDEYKNSADCKQYLAVLENKNILAEQMDKLVSLHKNCADVVKARDAFNANVNTKDPYENSKVQEQAKKKVDEANKKQAEQAAKAKKVNNAKAK